MRTRSVLIVALLLPAAAWADSAIEWLSRMSGAAHGLNYEGTFIYEHAGKLQTMQLYHGTDGKNEQERLVALDGASREVVRTNGKVTCILPDNKAVVVDDAGPGQPLPINVPTRIDQLESFYEARVAGEDRIAGRAARKIVIAPRDDYRYGQHLWLDEKSGLLLKAELRNEKGQVVEQLVFTRVKVHDGPLPIDLLQPQAPGKDLTWYQHDRAEKTPVTPPASEWVVTALPEGFREELRRSHRLPGIAKPVEHRVFSDGLASVSVFIEAAGEQPTQARSVRRGALNVYSRPADGYKVTVLGDVPPATVHLIGDGVQRKQEDAP
jgi:sigma-E factor negative regulatory protein RseB